MAAKWLALRMAWESLGCLSVVIITGIVEIHGTPLHQWMGEQELCLHLKAAFKKKQQQQAEKKVTVQQLILRKNRF